MFPGYCYHTDKVNANIIMLPDIESTFKSP